MKHTHDAMRAPQEPQSRKKKMTSGKSEKVQRRHAVVERPCPCPKISTSCVRCDSVRCGKKHAPKRLLLRPRKRRFFRPSPRLTRSHFTCAVRIVPGAVAYGAGAQHRGRPGANQGQDQTGTLCIPTVPSCTLPKPRRALFFLVPVFWAPSHSRTISVSTKGSRRFRFSPWSSSRVVTRMVCTFWRHPYYCCPPALCFPSTSDLFLATLSPVDIWRLLLSSLECCQDALSGLRLSYRTTLTRPRCIHETWCFSGILTSISSPVVCHGLFASCGLSWSLNLRLAVYLHDLFGLPPRPRAALLRGNNRCRSSPRSCFPCAPTR